MRDIAHLLRPGHLAQLRKILDDPEASPNDKFVALDLLKNANIAAGGVLPMCQDTGTAIVMGKKGQYVVTGGGDEEAHRARRLRDVPHERTCATRRSRRSTCIEEKNTGYEPARADRALRDRRRRLQVPLHGEGRRLGEQELPVPGDQGAPQPGEPRSRSSRASSSSLGTAACPPYHLAVVDRRHVAPSRRSRSRSSRPRATSTRCRRRGNELGPRRSATSSSEQKVLELAQRTGIGAQFGGKYFCHDVRVIRLPRHGASCPVAIAVSCSADRQALGKITKDGVFLEQLETRSRRSTCPSRRTHDLDGEVVKIDLTQPMSEIRAQLSRYPIKTRLSLSGPMIVARDIAHAKLKERLDRGAGPAAVPEGLRRVLRGPREDARGLRVGLVRADHGGPHGRYVDAVPGSTAAAW